MGNSVGYKGHPGLHAIRTRLVTQQAANRAAAEARLRAAELAASPIVVPAPRRERKTTPEAAPAIETTAQQES